MNTKLHYIYSVSSVVAALTFAQPVSAQSNDAAATRDNTVLAEVVVTAERRDSTAQKTAAAVSVRSGDDLQTQGKYTLQDILEDIPGIEGGAKENPGSSYGSGSDNPAAGLSIRGIQSNAGAGGSITGTAAAAAIYVDDVYSGIGGNYDINRVEVLRGPQGTLYGRSATAGVVAIHTAEPVADKFGGDISVEAGSYALRRVSGAMNLPLIQDKLAVRVSGNHFERDGYYSKEGDQRISTDGRVKLLFTPNEAFSALVGYAQQNNRTHTGGVTIYQPRPDVFVPTAMSTIGSGKNEFRQYWAELNWDIGGAVLTYIPALRTWTQDAVTINRIGGILNFDQTIKTPKDHFLTHELRLKSDYDSSLQWQVGLLSYKNELKDDNLAVNAFTRLLEFHSISEKSTEASGAFAEATWTFLPTTRLTAGLRYDHTEVQNNQTYSNLLGSGSISGSAGHREFDNMTYKVRLEHDLTHNNLIYAAVATGFSPGDVTIATGQALLPVVMELDAETLTAYELGAKNRFLDNRLQINVSAYYNAYGGYQSAGVNVSPNPAKPAFITIAAPVTSYGVEFEMAARPWANGQIGLNLAYTHARYDSFPAQYAYLFARNTIPGVVPLEANVSYEHGFDLAGDARLTLRADAQYDSKYDTARASVADAAKGALPYLQAPAQVTGNVSASVALDGGRYSITGYVRNITDEQYKTLGQYIAGSTSATLAPPRTYGLVLNARF